MSDPEPWIRPDDVQKAVTAWTGIERHDLITPHGSRRVIAAKRLLAAALRDGCSMSLAEVGRWMGYNSHAHRSLMDLLKDGSYDPVEVVFIVTHARERANLVRP